ncbi:MAG TPA: UDP-N-acetylglucosamine--N-acetylmuramyl-(pentapeptide) pyrophosphoryl-undecaprenol N-acetylglucosamine transferase [Candidatus Saccharimonadales bacterium]|nr:UDP-N-acetylglucosamine--N-acetylmuramyl-(pentapeptide) pyrophosphoryl-undecaprenol N-acetylglucosamine transferase [Candidatus Saccharimonadales bacterium]
MKIVMTGGGSGGHITPILAVAHEVKKREPSAQVIYIGQKGDKFASIVAEHEVIDGAYTVRAGKFRRYHGLGLKQVLDVPTIAKNLRDAFFVLVGLWQSFWLLGKLKPDVVFCKGGFVGVPVGLAAALRRIPYVTHDSDAVPGLANRIIARWAKAHAVALSPELYPYPKDETFDVGVPVSHQFQSVTPELQASYRRELGLEKFDQVVFVTGGGLGAGRINNAMAASAGELLAAFPKLCIVHTAGHQHEAAASAAYTKLLSPEARARVIVRDYASDLYRYSGAADVVVARGGATSFAEFAQQGRACIIIPATQLVGDHQTKNALAYAAKKAIILLDEGRLQTDPTELGRVVDDLLQHSAKRTELVKNIQAFARPNAARDLAELIIRFAAR